jgi:competence protein ComGC
MKTHYSLNTELNCANVRLNDRVYVIELPDLFKILNNEKKFVFVNFETEEYPSFLYNYKRVNYLQFIFKATNCRYEFKNKNIYDLRHSNVIIYQIPVNVKLNNNIESHNEITIVPVVENVVENVNIDHNEETSIVNDVICMDEETNTNDNSNENDTSIRHHYYHQYVIKNYNVIEYIPGHVNTSGRTAYVMKNPIWKVLVDEKEYYLMYCETESLCKLCPDSYRIIKNYHRDIGKNVTWSKCSNGYIQSHIRSGCETTYYIHQIIMDCHGNGRGTKVISVDHIDRDPLNNTLENLRLATDETQQQNKKGSLVETKRERKHNAIDLPTGITQDMMRKYVVYYHEWLDKEKTKEREFFKVEKHPKLKDIWFSSKSTKVTILDKLRQANKVVDDLEKGIQPLKEDDDVPKYVSLITFREKKHLVFEKRMLDGKRLNFKMVLPANYNLTEQLTIFDERILKKYEKSREELSV